MDMVIDRIDERLAGVFVRLFPQIDMKAAFSASIDTIADWDSICTLSLIVEAEEEFGIEIGFCDADAIESFSDLYRIVVCRLEYPFPGLRYLIEPSRVYYL